MSKKRPMWRPRLKLVQKATGTYWYVFWTCDLDELLDGVTALHPADHAPFMTRCSLAAKAAHAFAARLNQQRSLTY